MPEISETDIAVVGMACRCPGARDVDQLWDNLARGTESITSLTEADRKRSGIDHVTWTRPGYVRAAPMLDDYDRFDAGFFGYSPREAALLDPQQRVFLECAWTALEHAGYDSGRYPGAIGVYGGAAVNTYLLSIGATRQLRDNYMLTLVGNEKDYLTSRVSYKLGLTGPSVAVQTACSTSLVAVHLACQSILNGECDMALAGGVSVKVPQHAGYQYAAGEPFSSDGHCRTFDARASGTVFGSGVGIVVLKRLATALADADRVHGVIRGTAINNDGASKVDYTAPSVTGQAEVIAEALAHAGVAADTVSYVEAHGTGTLLGDPVEIAALTKAFQHSTQRRGFCAIGSVKTNVGHLDAAAGVLGLIKTLLALRHRQIPASLHFETPNPRIDFPTTPFYVNTMLTPWDARPRRAGVNSMGIGGTNAHVIVDEPPSPTLSGQFRPVQLIVLSAKTPTALDIATRNLAHHLAHHPTTNLADAAYTLQVGRRAHRHRRMLVCRQLADVVKMIDQERTRTGHAEATARPVVFLLPGGGSKLPPAMTELQGEPVFREHLERGVEELRLHSDEDFAALLLSGHDLPAEDFRRPSLQLPAVFVIEAALAALWMSWGIRPSALIGHSMGEITAAHLAGVLGFGDALKMVIGRAQLAERAPRGAMLSIALSEHAVTSMLDGELDLACVNSPATCVVSGPTAAIDAFARRLAEQQIETRRVGLDTAAHSRLLDAVLPAYEKDVASCALKPPTIPFVSNLTGTWIRDDQAVDPAYWTQQYRHTVRFADGVRELLGHPDRVFLEVGPGHTLSSFVRAHRADRVVAPSLQPVEAGSNVASLLDTLGNMWLAGVEVDWRGFSAHERRQRVPLPTYPFERQRHWFEASGEDAREAPRWGDPLRSRVRSAVSSVRHAVERRRDRAPVARDEPSTAMPAKSPATSATTSPTPGATPPTPTEQTIIEIWREVLGNRDVSIDADFFQLGGNSLLLGQVMRRVNQAFATELTLLTMLEASTVAELAQYVDNVRKHGS